MGQATEEDRNLLSSQTQQAEARGPVQEPEGPLLGSDVQPSLFLDTEGEQVQLGEVVRAAFKASHLPDASAWNNLPNEKREEYIQDAIDHCDLVPIEAETAEEDGQTDDTEGDTEGDATDEVPAAKTKKDNFRGFFSRRKV
jgi:hypothetical protein